MGVSRALAVKATDLTRRFGNFLAVDSLSFEVEEGEVLGLLGPNGAGKTTTVRMLACIISPTSGSATVAGHSLCSDPIGVRRSAGVLTENPSLYERLTAVENLEFYAHAYGISDSERIRGRIRELLEFFGLWERRGEKVAVFSKGMKQKLAIARALVHNPPVLFLDEPTSGLDPEAAKLIRDMVVELTERERRAVLLCTHRLEDAEKICDRVMIISRGSSKIVGSPDELRVRMAGSPKLEVRLRGSSDGFVSCARSMPSVRGVEHKDGTLIISADDVQAVTPQIVRALVEAGAEIMSITPSIPSLEDAYLKLIKEGAGQ